VASLGSRRPLAGLTISDFERLRADLGKGKRRKLGLVALKGELTRARMVFLYATENGVALPYRKALKSPSRKNLRKLRNEQGERMFAAKEIRAMIKAAKPQLRAMIHLGINAAFGPTDCGRLTFDKLDPAGWHTLARPKTQTPRRCPLWPETVNAIKAYLKERPEPKPGREKLVFLTKYGNSWARDSGDNAVSSEFADLLQTLNLCGGFYSLRRTFETIASATGQQAAVDLIMGHTPDSSDMGAVYRQRVFDSKLVKVSNYVRSWLLGRVKLS
jgi:integrase